MAAPLGGRLCAGTITAVSFKPAHSDLGMSGDGSTAAVGYVQFYARTRPTPATHLYEKRTSMFR